MKFFSMIQMIQKSGEVLVAISMIALLGVMLIPLPAFLLDLLLSLSIAFSVVILITSVYIQKPLDFSVFPSLLLITTLYRLSLNVASTKLILLKGSEGVGAVSDVISSFGNFVVGGNYAVGFIVFLILVIVNFVVITKGSGRIAEVAARFTLDAMPGKQMAIDADLNAGLIDENEARTRRSIISQEADFYGSMDGASKFVRGDAIAGLVITAINIISGLIIGTLQKGMPIIEAAKTYTILTVGDGLVSQIPALLVSTAAGLVVSRTGKETDLGKDIMQLFINPKSLLTAAGVLFVFGLIPNLPHLPFLLISAIAGGLVYFIHKFDREDPAVEEETIEHSSDEPQIESFLEVEPLTLEIGYALIPFVEEQSGELLKKVKVIRRQLAKELGFIVPPIHIKDNLQLRPNEYSFLIRGIDIAKNEVMTGHWLAVVTEGTEKAEKIDGIPTKEPAFGLSAYWIEEKDIEKAQATGYMVVDPPNAIATHLTELIRSHAWEILKRTEVQNLLDIISKTYPKLIDELIPTHMTLGGVQRVLQNLLKERVPINDLVAILETLLDYSSSVKDIDMLTEYARQALSRYISRQYMTQDGNIPVMSLAPEFESKITHIVESGEAINPDIIRKLLKGIEKITSTKKLKGVQPIVLCSFQVRRFLRKIMEKFIPSVVVLSNAEIHPSVNLFTLGMIKYED